MKRATYILLILLYILGAKGTMAQDIYTLQIESDKNVPSKLINRYQNYKGDSLQIISKLTDLRAELQSKGYLAASIDSIRIDSTYFSCKLYSGKQYLWSNLDFSLLESGVVNDVKLKKYQSSVVKIDELNSMKESIMDYYLNRGYPFVSVFLNAFEINDSLVSASLQVQKGLKYTIDSVIVKGDARISYNYIRKLIEIDAGQNFHQQSFNLIGGKIENQKFLSEIKPAEIEFKQQTVDLYLYLEKKKANLFNGIVGILPDDDGKVQITGELTLNLINSFARGEEILLKWEKHESTSQKLNVGFNYPYVFKSDFGIDLDFELYKKDSTYLNLNSGLGLRWLFSSDEYVKAYYRYKSSSVIGNVPLAGYADLQSNLFGVSYHLSKLDYRFNPRKGIHVDVYAGTGFKSLTDSKLKDSLVNIDNKSIEIDLGLDFDAYFPIYRNFIFHFSNRTRYLDQFVDSGKENLFFENELFRFGGANSLKGFDESIFLASIYSLQNVEIKYLFDKNSAFYVFWNGAYYYQNIAHNVLEDFPWGIGIGLDFDTRAGIFSLSYALGKQFDNPLNLQTAKIHFGYISRF